MPRALYLKIPNIYIFITPNDKLRNDNLNTLRKLESKLKRYHNFIQHDVQLLFSTTNKLQYPIGEITYKTTSDLGNIMN